MGGPCPWCLKMLRTTGLAHYVDKSSTVGCKMHCVNQHLPYFTVFSTCLAAWSPQFSVGPSKVSTPRSTPFSIGLIQSRTLLKANGSGGYLKTYWEVNSSTIWLPSSSCKSTSRMFCERLNTKGNLFSGFFFILPSLLSESSLFFSGKSLRDGNSSSRLCESRLWMWVPR